MRAEVREREAGIFLEARVLEYQRLALLQKARCMVRSGRIRRDFYGGLRECLYGLSLTVGWEVSDEQEA